MLQKLSLGDIILKNSDMKGMYGSEMNYFDGKTNFKVLTLYLRDQTYQFHNVGNCKVIETNDGKEYSFPSYHLSFDYVSQTTGRKNHGLFDCDFLVGMSYEE